MSARFLVMEGFEYPAFEARLVAGRAGAWTDGITARATEALAHPSDGTVAVAIDARAEVWLTVAEASALVDRDWLEAAGFFPPLAG